MVAQRADTRGSTTFLRISWDDWARGAGKVAGGIPKEGRKIKENYTGLIRP